MRFLRGRSADANGDDEGSELDSSADPADGETNGSRPTQRSRTPGKGRPTPRRKEAEARKRGPAAPPPRTQREAARRARATRSSKEERRKEAATRRERMMAGDEKYLLPRDRGPVKAYVRDVVDARRNVAGLFMPLAGIILLSIFIPNPIVQQYVSLLAPAMMLAMLAEGLLLGRTVNVNVRQRFPNEQVSRIGLGFYAITRATQLRRLRVPRPRVGHGQHP